MLRDHDDFMPLYRILQGEFMAHSALIQRPHKKAEVDFYFLGS
jgi:hypothetical protein